MKLTQQTSKNQNWIDEAGNSIPYNRLTGSEKLREKSAHTLAKQAFALNARISEFKTLVKKMCDEVVEAIRSENKIKTDSKGNFTWYNFNQSIKIEVNVNELIRFDEVLIDAAKDKLMKIISNNISGDDFIKSIVTEAFQTTTGKLDTRRILGLKKHSTRISKKDLKEEWMSAMELIDKSITRPESRNYFRIYVKEENGDFKAIDLNFSSVKA